MRLERTVQPVWVSMVTPKRYAILNVPPALLLAMLRGVGKVESNLPVDALCLSARMAPDGMGFQLLLTSVAFPEVPVGETPPTLPPLVFKATCWGLVGKE